MQQVDAYIMVNFTSDPDICPYAFDPGNDQSPYFSCGYFLSKYENLRIGASTNKYYVPWKFVPTGSTGKVQFTLDPIVEPFSDANLKLYTSFGAELKFSGSGDTYTVQLPPGEARTDYDLYAVYTKSDGKKVLAGKLRVRTESPKVYPVTLVTMATGISTSNIADDLNAIYAPFAIKWEVSVINGSQINATSWDYNKNGKIDASDQDEFLSEYSEEQKALHNAFISTVGKEAGRSVVFLFNSEVGGSVHDGAKLGDMPIKRKWGYMFGINGAPDARTLAHELGHGRLTLLHTFATEHCGGTSGHTKNHNLMDYPSVDGQAGSGRELNRFQWETAHNPAPIGKVFQDDEDAAGFDVCTLTKVLEYFNISQSGSKAKLEARKNIYDHIFDNYETLYTSLETNSELPIPAEEVDNIDGWSVRGSSLSSNQKGFLYERVLKKIEEAENETSISFSLFTKGIYLGKAKINELDYNLAIYTDNENISIEKLLADDYCAIIRDEAINSKVKVAEIDDYLLFAFFKNGEIEMVIQMMNDDDEKMKKLLVAFKVLKGETEINDIVKYPCSVCGRDLTVSKDKLDLIFPDGNNITVSLANHFNTSMKTAGFNTCKSHAHFFAQCYVETNGYTELEENPNYRYEGVLALHNEKDEAKLFFNQSFFDENKHLNYFYYKVYKNLTESNGDYTGENYKTFKWKNSTTDIVRVPTGGDSAYKLTKGKGTFEMVEFSKAGKIERSKKLFSIIYANNYGNKEPSTEDGYTYRGQGAMHLTWKDNYKSAKTYAKNLFNEDFDWVNHPEYLVSNEKDAVYSAVIYFYFRLNKDISKLNNWDVETVSYNVNGGYNGLEKRKIQFTRISTNVFELDKCKTKN